MTTNFMRPGLLTSAALLTFIPANAALAQDRAHNDDAHDPQDVIVVTAHAPVDFGILAATQSIAGDTLVAKSRGQIGDILSDLPGVSSTSFAPGASRPILRGFGGDRVAVLTDGIGAIDASSVSADHAVVFDALTIEHIDVFHGPAVLLYGGNAIGGAVDAHDKRIPRRVPDNIEAQAIVSYGTAADERAAGGAITVPITPQIAATFDANWRKSDDLHVGGHVFSRPLRDALLSEADDLQAQGDVAQAAELTDLANLSGHIPNSGARSFTLGSGIAYIGPRANLGVSIQQFDTHYGVPLRPGGEEDSVAIDLAQTKVDVRGGVELDGFFERIQFHGAFGDYRHVELEGDEAGTRFSGQGVEGRADLVQRDSNGWRGRSGVQYLDRKLDIVGEEAFVPNHKVEKLGLFTLQSLELGSGFEIEAAGRYERARVSADVIGYARSFDLWSGAAGVSWEPAAGWTLGVNYTHGARAPSPEELLSDGVHVANQSYELGNPDFGVEKSDGLEAYLKYSGTRARFSLTGYTTDLSGYIAALPSDEEREGFLVYRYTQLPARYRGFEASGSFDALTWDGGKLTLNAMADYTRASLKGVGPAPRIPPLRIGGGAQVQMGNLRFGGDVEWNDAQTRVARFADPVPGFTLVNLNADWHPQGEDGPFTVLLSADNLFDVNARRAASFTRDFVPLAGRDVRVTIKFAY